MNDLGPRTDFFDRMERLTIKVNSPNGSVRALYTTHGGVSVELRPDAIKEHTDQSLAGEVTAAVRGVLSGYNQAINTLLRDEGAIGVPYDASDPEQVDKAENYVKRVSDIHVKVVSQRGYAKAEVIPEDPSIRVGVRPGTLDRLDVSVEQLTVEINEVITRALEEHREARHAEHKKLYEVDYLKY